MPTIIDHVSKEKIYDMGCHLHLFRKYTTVAHRSGAFGNSYILKTKTNVLKMSFV